MKLRTGQKYQNKEISSNLEPELNRGRARSELELQRFILIEQVVENVRGGPNHGDPSSEHGHVTLELLQRRRLVWLPHKHAWKHFSYFFSSDFLANFDWGEEDD
ncbi:sulfate transporter 1 [Striga asiatica]|uniref:Sulfate transporter 1 n=1 Tax=Striga asiatica TaxID=4170 RepID=A0A5A7QYC0_STRAF|nr:sulfate transporter 1 [Striga asiatica]